MQPGSIERSSWSRMGEGSKERVREVMVAAMWILEYSYQGRWMQKKVSGFK